MALLAPLFLLGLAAVAVPVILHLSQRARRDPVRFPSLAFVRRVPFKTTERRRIRDRLLFALRGIALILLAIAFARPFLERGALGTAGVAAAREIVILLDGSASMGYGDRWSRAQDAVRNVARTLGPEDRATVVLFAGVPSVLGPPTGDPVQLEGYLAGIEPRGAATRYEPALDLARDLIEQSDRPQRAVVLITDFQRVGWDGQADLRLPAGTVLDAIAVGDDEVQNLAVVGVTLQRSPERGGRVTIAARVANLGGRDAEVRVRLGTGEQTLHELPTRVPVGEVALVQFPDIALPTAATPGWVAVTEDALAIDDVRRFVLRPIPRIAVLVVEGRGAGEREVLYVRRALAIGRDPALVATVRTTPGPDDVREADVVVLNDAPFPTGETGRALRRFLEEGGGVLWAMGPRARAIPEDLRDRLGRVGGQPVDRLSARGGVLGIADYGHPIFTPYRNMRGSDYGAVRVYRYWRVETADSARILAWTDDGAPILTESRVGTGRVVLWASDFGNTWNDLAVRAVFLPTVHEAVRYLSGHKEPPASHAIGQMLEPEDLGVDTATVELVLEAPDGSRFPIGEDRRSPAPLSQAGFYTLRPLAGGIGVPFAVNLDPAESDLAQLDRPAFLAAVAGSEDGPPVTTASLSLSAEERERRQRLWWYVGLVALAILVTESLLAGVRPRGIGA
ncbi:MAG: VWA domain-containing protein [Gemmatimonadota bacterium]|nr:VWA domain-containing protein [Gemmatimonadota bacterium]MDH5197191.1 VWA domain-containing protein [Gemmatimonadota bacterium]